MKSLLLMNMILLLGISPANAKKFHHVMQTAKVISTGTDYEWSDCEWKRPCKKTVAVLEAPDFRYSIRGAGWKGEHPNLFTVGQTVTFEYYGLSGLIVWNSNKKYIFKMMHKDPTTAPTVPHAQTPPQ